MKALRFYSIVILLLVLFAFALPTSADCPADDPDCPINPPGSQEVNPDSIAGDLLLGEAFAPGTLRPLEINVAPPAFVEPLPLPTRYQDSSDVTCGVQALGMALEGLGDGAPTSAALLGFLQGSGMMYDFGTGVEELAYAAQSFGYKGSLPFYGWSLEELQGELAEGRPVVVSLGTNGEGEPGHFVTVTGVSPDGKWVSYNDPMLGGQVVSAEEFTTLWGMQGNSGVVVRKAVPPEAGDVDYTPWVALAAVIMALISQTPFWSLRKGIGGMLDSGGSGGGPPYTAPPGYRWVRKTVAKYGWRQVQDGWTYTTKRVPKYERQRVQVGWTTVYDKIPRYKTVQVQDGWDYIPERVPIYRNERYVAYYRTVQERVPSYRYYGGRRYFTGYTTVTRREPVYGTRQVLAGWTVSTKRVPHMVNKRVFDGYDIKETQVPKYEWRDVQVGWTTETERTPRMVWKQVQVGTEVEWELEKIQTPTLSPIFTPTLTQTPPTTPTQSPTPSPVQTPPPTPETTSTPRPFVESSGPSHDNSKAEDVMNLLKMLPSLRAGQDTCRVPISTTILPFGTLNVGSVTTISASTNQNPDMWFDLQDGGIGARSGWPQAVVNSTDETWKAGIRIPGEVIDVSIPTGNNESQDYQVSTASSVFVTFNKDGFWNSTVTLEVNPTDMSTELGPTKISGQSGIYVEFNPTRLALAVVAVTAAALIVTSLPEISFAVLIKGALDLVGAGVQ